MYKLLIVNKYFKLILNIGISKWNYFKVIIYFYDIHIG